MDVLTLGYRRMAANQITFHTEKLLQGQPLALKVFSLMREELNHDITYTMEKTQSSSNWDSLLCAAEEDLRFWQQSSGKSQNYTPLTLAQARVQREAANTYRRTHLVELLALDSLHQAVISYAVLSSGLAEKLRAEGNQGHGLAVVELTARLSPSLTFPGSSEYLHGVVIPYAREARTVLGEQQGKNNLVSEAAVRESAKNAQRLFHVSRVLAETSTAPREDVPRSGRKPEAYICQLVEDKEKITQHIIDTPFREEFNAQLRELMFNALREMYK